MGKIQWVPSYDMTMRGRETEIEPCYHDHTLVVM